MVSLELVDWLLSSVVLLLVVCCCCCSFVCFCLFVCLVWFGLFGGRGRGGGVLDWSNNGEEIKKRKWKGDSGNGISV